MTLLTSNDKTVDLDIIGKLGTSYSYGGGLYGDSKYGYFDIMSGVYSVKHTRTGRQISRMRHYRPTNPNSEEQVARRDKFAAGMLAWQGLTTDDKAMYNRLGRARRMSGHNVFLSDYMRNP